jgi:hypothetical protein
MINIYGNGDLIEVTPKNDSRIEGQKVIGLMAQKRFYDMWYQQYASQISTAAERVFRFIIARTFTFNKTKEIISIRQFREGVYTHTDDLIVSGINYSKPTIIKAIAELEDAKFIIKTKRVDKLKNEAPSIFEVNIDFFNKEIIKNSKMKEDKNMQKKKKDKNAGLKKATEKLSKLKGLPDGFIGYNPQEIADQNQGSTLDNQGLALVKSTLPGGKASLTPLTIENTNVFSKEINQSKEEQSYDCRDFSEKKFREIYRLEMLENFRRFYEPPKGKASGQLTEIYKKMKSLENIDIPKFLTFCIRDWKHVCTQKLFFLEKHSQSSLPVSPQLGIILKFFDRFLECYQQSLILPSEKIETVYGDAVGFRAKELQKMGYSTEYALNMALTEERIKHERNDKTVKTREALDIEFEKEKARIRNQYEVELTLMRNKLLEAEEARRMAVAESILGPIEGFTLGSMSNPELQNGEGS